MILKIDQEFKNLIPPLTHDERKGLEENIKKNGCETPITVWDGTIIDGHNRYEICVENGISFEIKEISFADRDDAKLWMYKHELEWKGRRLNNFVRSSIALKAEEIIAKRSRQGMRTDLCQNSDKSENPKLDTKKELAKLAEVSHDTISKVKEIEKKATPEQIQELKEDKKSINKVYQEIKKQEAPKPEPKPDPEQNHFDEFVPDEIIHEMSKPCPIGKKECSQDHTLCSHWYHNACNYDWDTTCKSGACSMPSVQKPNAKCPFCGHDLIIDYDNYKVIT